MRSAMSSSKHQPIPRKRTIGDVTPEFPRRPDLSLKAAKEFAVKSQEALRSVSPISTNVPYLFLPRLSPHRLQYRFHVGDDNSVLVMMRKSYPLLKREVDTLDRNYYGIYVKGANGSGKSYLLYLLAAEYRMNREGYRVTYINDCDAWRKDKFGYILKELITTFYDDTIDSKTIVEWCQAVIGSDNEEKMMKMMDSLIDYIRQKKLRWIVICDQLNAFYARSVVVDQFPFSLIKYLSSNRRSNITVVISASANDEGYPTKMEGWATHDLSSYRFDKEEFKVWCDLFMLEGNKKVDHESEGALNALFWTGGVPYELDLLWKQPRKTLIEKTLLYRHKRVIEMADRHRNFCENASVERKRNLKECISRMALGLSPPANRVGMDREIFHIIVDKDYNRTITALNPVARRALLGYHGRSLMSFLDFDANIRLNGSILPSNIYGKVSVLYITTVLELLQVFTFQFRKGANIAKIGLSGDIPERKSVQINSVVYFESHKLPSRTSFRKNSTTLFVPYTPKDPRFDFFLWDAKRQVLMRFQVSVHNPFYDHPKITSSEMWQEFCFGNSKQTPMELYWIVPRCCVGAGTATFVNDSIILVEDLITDFPALGDSRVYCPL